MEVPNKEKTGKKGNLTFDLPDIKYILHNILRSE